MAVDAGRGLGALAPALGLGLLLWAPAAGAVDAITSASPTEHRAGNQNAAVWIVGRGFAPGTTVSVSGPGIQVHPRGAEVVLQAQRIDGGRGDGIAYYFTVEADAPNGPRDLTVTAPDGRTVTAVGLVTIVGGADAAPDPPVDPEDPPPDPNAPPDPNDRPDPNDPPVNLPPPQAGRVDVVARASPRYGAQGEQVNLWIVGRSFGAGSEVRFNVEGLGPATYEGQPLPAQVHRAAERIRGEAYDGIQYYLRIPEGARPGFVDISVVNPDGSQATGAKLFEIVAPGDLPQPEPGAGNIDEITGASPPALRAGRNAALWFWGRGLAAGAQVVFSEAGIRQVAPAEVVESAANYPGYGGLRAFVQVGPDTPPGLVDVSIRNPNNTVATAAAILQILPPAAGGGGAVGPGGVREGPCPDNSRLIGELIRVVPEVARRGEVVSLAIEGRDFACGASVVIKGGGLSPVQAPHLVSDAGDPTRTTMFWRLQVQPDAVLGPRDVTVVNPNNTSRTLVEAFMIEEGLPPEPGVHACAARPGAPGAPGDAWLALLLGAVALRLGRRGRRQRP